MIKEKVKEYIEKRKKETEEEKIFNNTLKNISYLNEDYAFEDKEKPLTKKEVDTIIDGLISSSESDLEPYEPLSEAEKKAFKRAKEIRKCFPEEKVNQFCILSQDLLSKMTYQSYLGMRFSDKKKDELLKKFNRRIIRNYILCAMLGGLVVSGVIMGPKIVKGIKQTVIEKSFERGE